MGSMNETGSYRQRVNEAKEHIKKLFEIEKVMYVTEIKVRLDGSADEKVRLWQWITQNALNELHNAGDLRRRTRVGAFQVEGEKTRRTEMSFYFPSKYCYADVAPVIRTKMDIINRHSAVASKAGSYAEQVVEKALAKTGFKVPSRDGKSTRRFRKKEWKGQHDLDFIAHGKLENRWYGIQVKNTLAYPEWDDVAGLVDVCDYLGLTPWFISRQLPGDYTWDLYRSGGFYTLFDKWLLPKREKELCKAVNTLLGIPVMCKDTRGAVSFLGSKLGLVHAYKPYVG